MRAVLPLAVVRKVCATVRNYHLLDFRAVCVYVGVTLPHTFPPADALSLSALHGAGAVRGMAKQPREFPAMFSIDVSSDASAPQADGTIDANELICVLLRQLVEGQQREIKLLEEIAHSVSHHHKQRQAEIANWKEHNPDLARSCRIAAEALAKVQNQYIHNLTEEIADSRDSFDSDFLLSEFVDRFGPRLSHLNGLLQVMAQLSAPNQPPASAPQ
jgi:hypothetical protein